MKRYILLLALLGTILGSNAAPVGRQQAMALATSFFGQRSVTEVKTPFEHFYVFNGEQCFVIMSADDCVLPVLGYSHEQPFNSEMAESTLDWLGAYDRQIQEVVEARVEASDEVKTAWQSLKDGHGLPVCNRSEVSPLIYTRWGQRSPYNMYCPDGCVTGCVAIAMAQIMRYWECPTRGQGFHSYVHDTYGTLSVDFGAAKYDWEHMSVTIGNASSTEAKEAIATLAYHCGVSVDMKYGLEASATPSAKVLDAMPVYFGYDPSMSLVYQRDYTDDQWKQLLKSELDASRPMYYAGQSRGAHAFICDGYDASGLFHFNWGWSGTNDGYYAIGALNPGEYSYNALNYAIVDIKPADGGSPAIPAPIYILVYPEDYDLFLEWVMPNDNPNYTYKVSRNGTLIASGLTETEFVDRDAPSGAHKYQVWAVSNGVDSNHKLSYEIELARIEAVPNDPSRGTVWGGCLEELGIGRVLKAYPNPGYSFYAWIENGQVVSTDEDYFIVVEEDRSLTAWFTAAGVDEEEDGAAIRKVEVFTLNGVKLETLDRLDPESLDNYAKGVYLLRITTDKGVVVKKTVR